MNKLSTLFIRTSLAYLALGTILGLLITIGPGYSFMHSHLALIGWVTFFIFGAAYKIIPHYSGSGGYYVRADRGDFYIHVHI